MFQERYEPNHGLDRNILVLALHKSGSMFLHRFYAAASAYKGIHFFSSNNSPPDAILPAGFDERYCKCPVRLFPASLEAPIDVEHPSLGTDDATPKTYIVQTRDPRDLLVSEYYSFGWSHTIEAERLDSLEERAQIKQMSVDEYALGYAKDALLEKCSNFLGFKDQVHVLRYEDMVLRFPSWARDALVPFCLPSSVVPDLVRRFAGEFQNVKETTPDEIMAGAKAHKRKMYPGDYLVKLQPETIVELNAAFGDFLGTMGY